jgi:P27 family predicted phage terminase small subunit
MSGRRPKPTKLKEITGNPGKRALNKSEPRPSGVPTCPRWIIGDARKEWNRISKELIAIGLLTSVDRAALAAYCVSYGRWSEAEQRIQKTGLLIKSPTGNVQKNPLVLIAEESMRLMRGFLGEFGMTPSSRSRISTTPQEVEDGWDKLFGSGSDVSSDVVQ